MTFIKVGGLAQWQSGPAADRQVIGSNPIAPLISEHKLVANCLDSTQISQVRFLVFAVVRLDWPAAGVMPSALWGSIPQYPQLFAQRPYFKIRA